MTSADPRRRADPVLFCPFCGESFEGTARCPDHDVALVPWDSLPRPAVAADPHEPLPWFSPRLHRGLLAACAAATLGAFLTLRLGQVQADSTFGGSMGWLALHGAPRLWLVPLGPLLQLLTLRTRSSPRAMQRARLALCVASCVAPCAVLWAWLGAQQAVALLAARDGQPMTLELGAGALVVWLAALPALYASARLGGASRVQPPAAATD